MASRKLIVEIIGDSRQLERAYGRGAAATSKFGKDIERTTRGVIAGSGAFRSLGRSVAFASASFLGGAGLIAVTRSAIDAASNLIEQQNKAKVVFGSSAAAVEQWSKNTAQSLGIASDKALEFAGVFGNILVPMGVAREDAAKFSTALVTLASDLASFNNADPTDTLEALKSGIVGQVRPLRQYGVFLSDARVKAEALADGIVKLTKSSSAVKIAQESLNVAEARAAAVRQKSGAQSREYAQAQIAVERAAQRVATASKGSLPVLTDQQKLLARLRIIYKDTGDAQGDFGRTLGTSLANKLRVFRASVQDLQAELGKVLLPAISRVVSAFNRWLGKGQNRESVVNALKTAVGTLGTALRKVWTIANALVGVFGGWKTALELAIGAWVGFKVAGVAAAVAVQAANLVAAGVVESAWKAALLSTGWGAVALLAGAAAAYIITHWEKVKQYFKLFWLEWQKFALEATKFVVGLFSHIPRRLGGGWAQDLKQQTADALDDLEQRIRHTHSVINAATEDTKGRAFGPIITPEMKAKAGLGGEGALKGAGGTKTTTKVPKVATFTQISTWRDAFQKVLDRFALALSRAELTKSLQDDLAVLNAMRDSIVKQLAAHKGDLELQQKLVDVAGQRKQLEEQIAQNAKDARNARQFRALGLTATGDEPVPGVKALRRQLAHVNTVLSGTFLDTRKTQSVLARIRKVLRGGLGAVGRDVRSAIAKILADLDQQLKQHAGDRTKFRHANTARLLAGLGLSPDELRAVRARIATIGPNGVVPAGRSVAFAGAGVVITGPVHVHGVQNPRQFEENMHKRAQSRPNRRRGGV